MVGQMLKLRLRAPNGQHVINQFPSDSSLEELKANIAEVTKIAPRMMKLLRGYPPKLIDRSDDHKSLTLLHFQSGETLIVEEDTGKGALTSAQKASPRSAKLCRHVVPANNSCLFTSINFVMEGGKVDLDCAQPMRELIAGIVMSDPATYNEAFLGRSNSEYSRWITTQETWGGAIEVSILSKYYGIEIDVIDTQSTRIDRFGEDQNYDKRVLLIYDGIHYDPIKLVLDESAGITQTVFATSEDVILAQALELASEAKASRQFTDLNKFSLRCLVCNQGLTGQNGAQQHAKETGHFNFGEV